MAVAVKVPKVSLIVCGGFRRRLPVGGCAKGMPLKESMLELVAPTTVPLLIDTDGPARGTSSTVSTGAGAGAGTAAARTSRARQRTKDCMLKPTSSPGFLQCLTGPERGGS